MVDGGKWNMGDGIWNMEKGGMEYGKWEISLRMFGRLIAN